MGKIIIGMALAVVIGGVGSFFNQKPEPDFSVRLSDADAYKLAGIILADSDVRGCGAFEVANQNPRLHSIEVTCETAAQTTTHRLEYFPRFLMDGSAIDHRSFKSLLDEPKITRIFCTRHQNGDWDQAFLREYDASNRARDLSSETDLPVRVYYGYEESWIETAVREDGTWSDSGGEWHHDPKGVGPDGCRI